jgi:hypothetical protein
VLLRTFFTLLSLSSFQGTILLLLKVSTFKTEQNE